MQIKLTKIKFDERLQNRVKIDSETVKEYSDAIDAGVKLPDVTVFFDGSDYWLADGFHRYHAHDNLKILEINADVRNGTLREAILFSVGVNAAHGLRRTNADKRKAVETMLDDEVWSKWADREIARACVVSPDTVGRIRKEIVTVRSDSEDLSVERSYTTKHGTQAVMNTANIGSKSNNHQENKHSKNNNIAEEIEEKITSDQETYGDFDPVAELEAAHKEIERLTQIIDSDDQLAEANKEIKRLSSLCETQQFRINSLMSEKAEAVRYAKLYKSKLEKLEKQVSKSDLVDF